MSLISCDSEVKNDKVLKISANTLSVKETKTLPDESVTTAYQLAQCFKRRAIAYDFANLISFTAHDTESLMHHLSVEPPPNFQHTTIDQILRADREVWLYLTRNVENIRPVAGGPKSLDAQLAVALRDYRTSFHLMPLPKEGGYGPMRAAGGGASQQDDPVFKGGKGKKGKGKNKASGSNAAPRGYIGCVGKDGKNRSICFDWNISECSHASAGAACRKGRHVRQRPAGNVLIAASLDVRHLGLHEVRKPQSLGVQRRRRPALSSGEPQ